jgi:hypothetical protein
MFGVVLVSTSSSGTGGKALKSGVLIGGRPSESREITPRIAFADSGGIDASAGRRATYRGVVSGSPLEYDGNYMI